MVKELFPQLLGALYLIVFGSLIPQIPGLIGSKGILPAEHFLKRYRIPTLYRWNSSDRFLVALPLGGCFAALLLVAGLPPLLLLPLVFAVHLSIINAGQDFLSFGWEMFLCEIVLYTFLWQLFADPLFFLCLNFLLFRFHFEAGVSKWRSRDKNWRNQSAVAFHYESQPLPNTQAYYFHKLPLWFHKISCASMLFIEIAVPFAIFTPFRVPAAVLMLLLQFFIWFTGNFSYLNHMTALFLVILFAPLDLNLQLTPFSGVAAALLLLQGARTLQHFIPLPAFGPLFSALWPWRILNRYGIFAVMTTQRIEIVFEGSQDGVEWKAYLFKYKPSEPERRPRRISPLQPRLDWQAWFLPFTDFSRESWVQNFMARLLEGEPSVLKLLRFNPFPETPPKYIRARQVLYTFTSLEEKRQTGRWWNTRDLGLYSPMLKMK